MEVKQQVPKVDYIVKLADTTEILIENNNMERQQEMLKKYLELIDNGKEN